MSASRRRTTRALLACTRHAGPGCRGHHPRCEGALGSQPARDSERWEWSASETFMIHMQMRVPVRPSPARQCTASMPWCLSQISRNLFAMSGGGIVQSARVKVCARQGAGPSEHAQGVCDSGAPRTRQRRVLQLDKPPTPKDGHGNGHLSNLLPAPRRLEHASTRVSTVKVELVVGDAGVGKDGGRVGLGLVEPDHACAARRLSFITITPTSFIWLGQGGEAPHLHVHGSAAQGALAAAPLAPRPMQVRALV
jgi:hypothetical protein